MIECLKNNINKPTCCLTRFSRVGCFAVMFFYYFACIFCFNPQKSFFFVRPMKWMKVLLFWIISILDYHPFLLFVFPSLESSPKIVRRHFLPFRISGFCFLSNLLTSPAHPFFSFFRIFKMSFPGFSSAHTLAFGTACLRENFSSSGLADRRLPFSVWTFHFRSLLLFSSRAFWRFALSLRKN